MNWEMMGSVASAVMALTIWAFKNPKSYRKALPYFLIGALLVGGFIFAYYLGERSAIEQIYSEGSGMEALKLMNQKNSAIPPRLFPTLLVTLVFLYLLKYVHFLRDKKE